MTRIYDDLGVADLNMCSFCKDYTVYSRCSVSGCCNAEPDQAVLQEESWVAVKNIHICDEEMVKCPS